MNSFFSFLKIADIGDVTSVIIIKDFYRLSLDEKRELCERCVAEENIKPLVLFSKLACYSRLEEIADSTFHLMVTSLIDRDSELKIDQDEIPLPDHSSIVNILIRKNNTFAGTALSAWHEYCPPESISPAFPEKNKKAIASVINGYMENGCDIDVLRMASRSKDPVLDLCWDLLSPPTQKSLKCALGRASPDKYIRGVLEKNPATRCALSRDSLVDRLDQMSGEPLLRKSLKKL